jgi:hypothetical protein
VGTSTDTDGYTGDTNGIQRFSFNAPYTSSVIGTFNRRLGAAAQSTADAYMAGGRPTSGTSIDIFPFSTPFTSTTTIGFMTKTRYNSGGHSSTTDGYISGGQSPFPVSIRNDVDVFPFSSPTTGSVGGTISPSTYDHSSVSSSTDGYMGGGRFSLPSPTFTNDIDRFPFTTPFTGSVNIGNLSGSRRNMAGMQSDNDGYFAGGQAPGTPPTTYEQTVDRFPFASPFTFATDIGDLAGFKFAASGHQS